MAKNRLLREISNDVLKPAEELCKLAHRRGDRELARNLFKRLEKLQEELEEVKEKASPLGEISFSKNRSQKPQEISGG